MGETTASQRMDKIQTIIVIDTDVLIDLGNGVAEAMARVKTEALTNRLTISVITKLELLVGCQNQTEMRSLEQFLVQFEVIPLSAAIGNQAVNLLKQYRLSHGLLMPDALIAATALTLDGCLLSKNQRDFRFIQDLKLLPYPIK